MPVVGYGRDSEILHASEIRWPGHSFHCPKHKVVGKLRQEPRQLILRNPGDDGAGWLRSITRGRHLHLFVPAYTVDDMALVGICVLPSYMMDERDFPVASQSYHAAHLNSLHSQPVCVR